MDLLAWRPIRTLTELRTRQTLQLVMLAGAALLVLAGLLGPQSAPRNLATVATWIYFRGLLILALLVAGNLFCAVCPMMLVRDLGRRILPPRRRWPRQLRNKWIALALLTGGLYAYEYFGFWNLPAVTAFLILGYFAAALVVDLTYTGASFCKFVCPIGQFNFVTSTLSPFELQVRKPDTCRRCQTVDCIKGTPSSDVHGSFVPMDRLKPAPTSGTRGCELALFLPAKVGNLDCTLCFDCVRACPHDNIGLMSRTPAAELAVDERRSGIGRLTTRFDMAALVVVFTFGALVNAFAMTGTAAHLQHLLMHRLGLGGGMLFLLVIAGLVIAPVVLISAAAWATGALTAVDRSARSIAGRYVYALVPLGAAVWLAHFGFHTLTGALTIVPVVQSAAIDLAGHAWMGTPLWSWTGVRPGLLFPAELGCLLLGALGSSAVAYAIAQREHRTACAALTDSTGRPSRPWLASLPWQALIVLLTLAATWTLLQPMDMRGMLMPG